MTDQHNPSFDFLNASANEIASILSQYRLGLTADEAKQIQTLIQRPPSLAECVLWGIQGSEHCAYKSSKRFLKTLPTKGPNVILGAEEDAGIIHIATDESGKRYALAISHESHNHPSQVEPYGGAATGVGGNVRDVNCMGAEVIATADSLRFGSIGNHRTHWIYEGVVEGIASYGNAIGVPNITGDLYFDSSFNQNCLVTAITLGLLPESRLIHSKVPGEASGYDLILIGQPTDESGFGGASFSSKSLSNENDSNRGAIQQANAFLGRVLMKANQMLFETLASKGLIDQVGFKDLGAGGIGCASIELANSARLGAEIWLDRVPVADDGLLPIVKLCSETQERYLWACPPEHTDMILSHYNETIGLSEISENARATVIGRLTDDGVYQVKEGEQLIINAPAKFICEGIEYKRPYIDPPKPKPFNAQLSIDQNGNDLLLDLLSHENVASAGCVYENYDKQVQGRTVIERGQADAGVFALFNTFHAPLELRRYGVALAASSNPHYGVVDPYQASINAVVEAFNKVISVGCTPQAITDCLCFGNPENEAHMGAFVRSVEGIKTACEQLTLIDSAEAPLPVVAGNVSFYNEAQGKTVSPSPLISCVGSTSNFRKTITHGFKKSESALFIIGAIQNELGGSLLYSAHGVKGQVLVQPDLKAVQLQAKILLKAISENMINSMKANTCGGLASSIAQMSIKGNWGCHVELPTANTDQLFNESPVMICEVKRDKINHFKLLMENHELTHHMIGHVAAHNRIKINTIDLSVNEAHNAWINGLRDKVRC